MSNLKVSKIQGGSEFVLTVAPGRLMTILKKKMEVTELILSYTPNR